MSHETADIVIIGAGIIGLSTAFQIARRSGLKVIVFEKGLGLGEGSTGASSAVCRYRYSRPEMVQLAKDGIEAYRNWAIFLDIADPRAHFSNDGVLWLGNGRTDWPEAERARLSKFGLRIEVFDDDELRKRFPAINPCLLAPDVEFGAEHDCVGGGIHLLEVDGGYIDPVDALHDLADVVRARGVSLRLNAEVANITQSGGRATGVKLTDGATIAAPVVVNASGPWCNVLFERLGLDLGWPLVPTRIQVVHIDRPPALEGAIPVTVDVAAGIYFRTQNRGQQILVSSVREDDEKEAVGSPDEFARYVDDDFEREKLHALHHRLPALNVRNVRGYSGLYTVNRSDVHPIVGETPIAGLYAANGCSGHGFKLAPAIGALLAQRIVGESSTFDTKVSLQFLSVKRSPIQLVSKSVLA